MAKRKGKRVEIKYRREKKGGEEKREKT